MVDITDITAMGVFIGILIPLMSAILQYRQSVKQEYEKSFRAIVEKLSAGKKEERVAAASSIGTFIRKSGFIRKRGQFYDESIDVLVNKISIELDHNVLNAIRGSLEKIEKKDYRDVIQKLLAIDRNFFVFEYPINGRINKARDDIERDEKEYYRIEASFTGDESKVDRMILDNLEKEIVLKHEMYSSFERNLAELKFSDDFVTNFISSFLNATGFHIKQLKFYRNSMNNIVLSDIELIHSKIYLSAFSPSTISSAIFDNDFKKQLDGRLKDITEDGFKEYVSNESDLSEQSKEDIFKTLNYLRFLFSWDCVPGQDKNRLLDFLTETLDSSWVKNAKIVKSEDDITRYVFAGEKSVEITLDENMEKAVLKANDGRIYNLQLKQETGRINIYRPVEN